MPMREHHAGYLQKILDGLDESIMVIDADYSVRLLNASARQHAGLSDDHPEGLKCHEVSHGSSRPCGGLAHPCPLEIVLSSGDSVTLIHSHKRPGGRWRFMEILASPILDARGNIEAIVESSRDVTERIEAEETLKQALSDKDVLIKEIHHHVKNNLMVVQSLLRLQSRGIADEKTRELFDESESRVRAIGMIHERLYRTEAAAGIEVSGYMRDLLTMLMRGYHVSSSEIKANVDVPEMTMDIDTIMPCGLIVNELVSNALKHAFPKGRHGEVYVGLKSLGGGLRELEVRDTGAGLPEGLDISKAKTLGLQIVTSLVSQLGGEMEIDRHYGTGFRIRFREKRYRE